MTFLGHLCETRLLSTLGDVADGLPAKTCHLPFMYEGETYNQCAPADTDPDVIGETKKEIRY